MTGLPLVIFSKYWFPLRSVPTKRARDPTLSRDFSQDITVITGGFAGGGFAGGGFAGGGFAGGLVSLERD